MKSKMMNGPQSRLLPNLFLSTYIIGADMMGKKTTRASKPLIISLQSSLITLELMLG
jgi:hypothetical protein